MIESIAEIGRVYRKGEDVFDLVIEYPKVEKIIAICVDMDAKTATICDEGDATHGKVAKTLYVKPPSSGTGAVPTAIITTPEKTLQKKIIPWFRKHGHEEIANIIASTVKTEVIKQHLPSKGSALLTVKIDGKWPAEVEWVVEEFKKYIEKKMYYGDYGGRSGTESKGDGVCAICGKQGQVYGFVLPWAGIKFATADKPGFFRNFNITEAWKVLPVCKECAWNIRIGWNIVTNRESEYAISGLNYIIVPSKGAREEEIEEFIESIRSPNSKFAVLSELAEAEETIEDIETNIDLLVYRKEQAKMEVYLLEQNIPPGIFRKMRKRNREITTLLYEEKKHKGPTTVTHAYADILNAAYSDEKSKTKKLKELAQVIRAIIREQNWPGRKYAYFTKYIEKRAHNEQRGLDFAYIAPLFVYMYFTGGDELSENLLENIAHNFPSKTAEFAFWTGVLARHVTEMQKKSGSTPGSEPFRKRIKNVRMNIHQLQRLYTDAFEKAKTYSEMLGEPWITWTNKLVESCAERATSQDPATPDEIGFFFALGYGLYWKIVKPEGGEKNGE